MKRQLATLILSTAMGALALGMDNGGDRVRQITYSYKGTRSVLQMSLDAKAQAALEANPVAVGKKGEALVEALEQRGGVLQDVTKADGTLVPSEQQFDERTGKRTSIIYRHAGQQQDPKPGVAAVQGWDVTTGAPSYTFYFQNNQLQNPSSNIAASTQIQNGVTVSEFYQAGKLEDPQPGKPGRHCVDSKTGHTLWEGHYRNNLLENDGDTAAWQEFDPVTQHQAVKEYCHNGLYNDPPNGEPAKQIYDGKTGALVSASRCSAGKVTHELDAQELAAFAAKKNIRLQTAPATTAKP
jgi:hypothetical protein